MNLMSVVLKEILFFFNEVSIYLIFGFIMAGACIMPREGIFGMVLKGGKLAEARLAALSSRISYELVQKAARARLPLLVSISRPTALAVELGQNLNMTLACSVKESGLLVFCGEERLTGE